MVPPSRRRGRCGMSAHVDRRRFLSGVAAITTAAAAGAAVAALPDDADAPFFALLRQHEVLDGEFSRLYGLTETPWREQAKLTDAAKEAKERYSTAHNGVLGEVWDRIHSDNALLEETPARLSVTLAVTREEIPKSIGNLYRAVSRDVADDPRLATVKAEWEEAQRRAAEHYDAHLARLEQEKDAAFKAMDAAERLIITYPVRTPEGLRAKLAAIHDRSMDPQDGETPSLYPVHDMLSFAALILADVERVMGKGE